jgi:hypothetical protein
MSPVDRSRFIAFWKTAEDRARLWFSVALIETFALVMSIVATDRLLSRPREVIRIGCDGIPQVVRINEQVYSEPDEREIKAFAVSFAEFYARSDSYSVVNDLVWCAKRMTPELREQFKLFARGTQDRPGIIRTIEALKRRTQIDISEVQVEKQSYPWHAVVRGLQQVVGQPEASQRFELQLDLVRTSRDELIEGLLVSGIRAKGDAFVVGLVHP